MLEVQKTHVIRYALGLGSSCVRCWTRFDGLPKCELPLARFVASPAPGPDAWPRNARPLSVPGPYARTTPLSLPPPPAAPGTPPGTPDGGKARGRRKSVNGDSMGQADATQPPPSTSRLPPGTKLLDDALVDQHQVPMRAPPVSGGSARFPVESVWTVCPLLSLF